MVLVSFRLTYVRSLKTPPDSGRAERSKQEKKARRAIASPEISYLFIYSITAIVVQIEVRNASDRSTSERDRAGRVEAGCDTAGWARGMEGRIRGDCWVVCLLRSLFNGIFLQGGDGASGPGILGSYLLFT